MEHGKRGDRIAVVLNGRQIYKTLYRPTNPRTPKQQMHRAKLAVGIEGLLLCPLNTTEIEFNLMNLP